MKKRSFISRLESWIRHQQLERLLLLVLIGTVIGLFVWTLITMFVISALPLDDLEWARVEPWTAVGALAFTFVGGVVVLHQIIESVDSRNLEIYQDIYEKMMDLDQINARRYIYRHVPDMQTPEAVADFVAHMVAEEEVQDTIKQVLNLIDYFGFLVEQEWVSSDAVIGWMSPIVVKVWAKIGPIVMHERSQRPEEPDYYKSAETLALRCQAWREQNVENWRDIRFSDDRM